MRRTIINVCLLGALAALPLSAMIIADAPVGGAAVVDAAMNGNRDAVRALLKDGADVNTTQADGMTALHWAAQKGDVDMAQMLLRAGARANAVTRYGVTALSLACANGSAEMVAALLAGGADGRTARRDCDQQRRRAAQRAGALSPLAAQFL